jgi:hypothetical protein
MGFPSIRPMSSGLWEVPLAQ